MVGGLHAGRTYGADVADGLFHIVLDNAVGGGNAGPAKGQDGALNSAGHTAGHFHGTTHLGPITHHAGDIPGYVLDGGANLLISAALQVHYAAGAAGRGHYAAAEGR